MNHFIAVCLTLTLSFAAISYIQAIPREFCFGDGCLCKSSFNLYYDFTIDLSFAFEYPVKDIGDKFTPNFYYIFSPCQPVPCRFGLKTAAICQFDKHNNSKDYQPTNCGEVSKAVWTIENRDIFTVVYRAGDEANGDFIRESKITFHVNYTSSNSNKIEFLGTERISTPQEKLVYNFNVTLNNKMGK